MFSAPSLAVKDGDEATSASAAGSGPATATTAAAAATDATVRHRRNAVLLMCSFPSQASDAELFMNRAFRTVPSRSMIHVDRLRLPPGSIPAAAGLGGVLLGGLFVECSIEQSGLVGEHDRLNPVAEAELLEDVRDVRLHGRFADVELLADLCVG